VKKLMCSEEEVLERPSPTNRSVIERPEMVERQVIEESSNLIGSPINRSRDVDGCIPQGMGSSCAAKDIRRSGIPINGTWFLGQSVDFKPKGAKQ
jgi:hypothetical protein